MATDATDKLLVASVLERGKRDMDGDTVQPEQEDVIGAPRNFGAAAELGVQVTVIRPGFVHSRMTRGMRSAPFATTPRVVGGLAFAGMRKGHHTVWTPGVLRYVFSVLRHVPRPIFRRLPLG